MISANKRVWTWAAEGTYGTDAVDALLVANSAIVYQAVNAGSLITPVRTNTTPARAIASQSGVKSFKVDDHSTFEMTIPFKAGVGTPNTPNYAPLLKACGFGETLAATTSTYVLGTSNASSITLWNWYRELLAYEFRLRRATGCLGTASFNFAVGEEAVIALSGLGIGYYDLSADAAWFSVEGNPILDLGGASTSTGTRDTAERMICKGMTITYNSGAVAVSTLSIVQAANVQAVKLMSADPISSRITRTRDDAGNATVSLSIETTDDSVTYEDFQAAADAEEVANLVILLEGATRNCTITARIQLHGPGTERANAGVLGFDFSGILTADFATHPFGDNELTLLYATT
jgi:hypothetical protein